MTKTMTRSQLKEAISQRGELSHRESSDLLAVVIDIVINLLLEGKTVQITTFGKFMVRKKRQRIGRNPRTGDIVPILPRRVLVFRPSQLLNGRVNASLPFRTFRSHGCRSLSR